MKEMKKMITGLILMTGFAGGNAYAINDHHQKEHQKEYDLICVPSEHVSKFKGERAKFSNVCPQGTVGVIMEKGRMESRAVRVDEKEGAKVRAPY